MTISKLKKLHVEISFFSVLCVFIFSQSFSDAKAQADLQNMGRDNVSRQSSSILERTARFEERHFAHNSYGVRQGKRTDAILVYAKGEKLFEKYDRGFSPNKKHIMWSVSKTLMGLIFGVAYTEGLVKLDQSICDFIQNTRSEHCRIKIRDLLSWTTGISWLEEYEESTSPEYSSVIAMLYGQGRHDMAKFVLDQKMEPGVEPGQIWRYSSGDTLLAALVLKNIFKNQNLRHVLQEKFFQPLGIEDWVCEVDGVGTLGAAYYFYLNPNDLIKVGQLILNDGRVGGKQMIAPDYLRFMKETPKSFFANRKDHEVSLIPGASLWLNDPGPSKLAVPWPGVPSDALGAQGHWGQYLLVIPSLKIVAVRLGDTRDRSMKFAEFAESVMSLVGEGTH